MSGINLRAVAIAHRVFVAEATRELGKALRDIGEDARRYAIHKSPEFKRNRPSKTREATKFRVMMGRRISRVRVWNSSLVARVLQSGSKAHTIEARRRRALGFKVDNKLIFRRRVHHPGTKPTNWWTNLEKHSQDYAVRRVQRALRRSSELFRRLRA